MPEKPIPEQDPITSKSYAAHYLIATVILMVATLFWALWDEAWGQRPWKAFQEQWKDRYSAFLNTARSKSATSENDVEQNPDYAALKQAYAQDLSRIRKPRPKKRARSSTTPAPACSRCRAFSPTGAPM